MTRAGFDGRWICLAFLALYAAWLAAGPVGGLVDRWQAVGVYAYKVPFADLQLFPATRKTIEQGGDPYLTNPLDPWQRTYNYPRLWLSFMRFSGDPAAVNRVGLGLAAAAIAAVLLFWGRLSPGAGVAGGLLLCGPGFMLALERGNTDLIVFVLLAAAAALAGRSAGRTGFAAVLWFAAAILKLYPVLAAGATWRRPLFPWLLRLVPAALGFGLYLMWNRAEIAAALHNTPSLWLLSYGARVPGRMAAMVLERTGVARVDAGRLDLVLTLLALAILAWAIRRGLRLAREPAPAGDAPRRFRTGFRVAAILYVATFLAGDSFDYRQVFLLLAFPALWAAARGGGRDAVPAALALVSVLACFGLNYFLAGWGGFAVKQAANWVLFGALAVLLTADLARTEPAAAPNAAA